MKIAVVHLSDIHVRLDRPNPLLGVGLSAMVPALLTRLRAQEIEASFLVVTGDIANTGHENEYGKVIPFIEKLKTEISAHRNGHECHVVVVPGNHDCDFRGDYQLKNVRTRILSSADLEDIDGESVGIVKCVQEPYRKFERYITGEAPSRMTRAIGPCVEVHDFEVGGNSIRFILLDTAWMSSIEEKQGALVLPTAGLSTLQTDAHVPRVTIVLQHHPRNWLRDSNAREVARNLEGVADIILTGHEHESDDARLIRASGSAVDYIEGFAAQLHHAHGKLDSGVKLIIFDLATQTQCTDNLVFKNGLYSSETSELTWRELSRNPRRFDNSFPWNEKGLEFTSDCGLPVSHKNRERVLLADIFVYPHVRDIHLGTNSPKNKDSRVDSGKLNWAGSNHLVIGSDLSGKSTLGKRLFSDLRTKNNIISIYINGINVDSSDSSHLSALVDRAFKDHYLAQRLEDYRQLPKGMKAVVLDDMHRSSLRSRSLETALEWLEGEFDTIVALADSVLIVGDRGSADAWARRGFVAREILPMGYVKRDELVRRWSSLGEANSKEMQDKVSMLAKQVDAIMGKRFVPPVPMFVIAVLQEVQAQGGPTGNTASQGAVFEALAVLKLQREFRDELLTAKNYLAHFAFALHTMRSRFMTQREFESWHQAYCEKFKLKLPIHSMRNRLIDSQVLQVVDHEIGFRHRFGYYLFVAEHFARDMESPDTRSVVAGMFLDLFHEETANILVFLCFKATGHTAFIVREMMSASGRLFSGAPVARLGDDVETLAGLIRKETAPSLAELSGDSIREQALRDMDDSGDGEPYGDLRRDDLEREREAESSYPEELRQVYSAVRTIQLLGQVLRNFSGTLSGSQKSEIATECHSLSLRVVGYCIQSLETQRAEAVPDMAKLILQRKPKLRANPSKLLEEAGQVLLHFQELIATGMVKRAADATAIHALSPVISELFTPAADHCLSPAQELIRMEHDFAMRSDVPIEEVRRLARMLEKAPFAARVLQHLAVIYMSTRHISTTEIQKVCACLEIEPPKMLRDPARKTSTVLVGKQIRRQKPKR